MTITQSEKKQNDLITIHELLNLIASDDLDKKGILRQLQKLSPSWKYSEKDEDEMFFTKKTDKDVSTEILIWHFKTLIIEYITVSTNQFSKLSLEIKENGFEITKNSINKYGGETNIYSKGNLGILTDVIPTASTGKTAFQFFIMQKR